MLIDKIICPYGCSNSVFTESTRTVTASNSDLLLDSNQRAQTPIETIKSYTCQCCGKGFETHLATANKNIL